MSDQQIRDYIDSLAQPLSLDEVVEASTTARVVSMGRSHRVRPLTMAAVLLAALGLAGFALISLRSTSSSVGSVPIRLDLTPSDPQVGTSFVATLVGEDLDAFVVRREAHIERLVGGEWQQIWLVYPVFLDATALPPEPVDLSGGNVPPGGSPLRLVATRPFRVTLPRQLAAGPYRFCLRADTAGSSAADDNYCAPIIVQNAP